MSMFNRVLKSVACAGVIALAATCAKADQFRLTLPVQTEWGRTTLPPGQYDVTAQDMGTRFLKLEGNGQTVFVLLSSVGREANAPDAIKVVNADGVAHVQELSCSHSGMVYRFAPAKDAGAHTVAFKLKKQKAAH